MIHSDPRRCLNLIVALRGEEGAEWENDRH